SAQAGRVTAAYGTSGGAAPLTVRPIGVKSVSVSPSSVVGGGQSAVAVKLECAAGPSGVFVTLRVNKGRAAKFIDPSSGQGVNPLTLVPASTSQMTFQIQTYKVASDEGVNVSATAGGATKNARLQVRAGP
ncbi:MAG TPA: hypothetical protein VD968_08825, partial [Pyrinomonadaceae bacterium]|nr:hypothetical protein [Pyrinomonadaceae bacterium]